MSILASIRNEKKLWLVHVVANAGLLALIYEWLWIPDRTVTNLVVSALTGIAIIGLVLLLQGGTLAFFRTVHSGQKPSWISAFGFTASRLTAFALWAFILVALIVFVFWLGSYQDRVSNWLSSFLTFRLRTPVTPSTVAVVFSWVIFITAFVVLPAVLLPFGSRAAHEGLRAFAWTGLRSSFRTLRRLRYWITYVALFTAGAIVPYVLVWWIPEVSGFYAETASLAIRFLIAYLLAVTAWLLLASMVSADIRGGQG